jgi:hypothetical protein
MGVVRIVVGMPCCSVGGMAHVASGVRQPCWKPGTEAEAWAERSLRSRPGLGRGGDCARGQGVGRGGDRARGQGVGRDGDCARGKGVGRDGDSTRGQGVGRRFYSFLLLFVLLIWVSWFMVPNNN